MTMSAPKPIRRYAIHRHACYPIRDAARAADVPLGRLRRAVILGDVAAEAVDDDREYLVQGYALQAFVRAARPGENPDFRDAEDLDWGIGLFLAFPLVAFLVCAAGLTTSSIPADMPRDPDPVEVKADPPPGPTRPWNWFLEQAPHSPHRVR